MITTLNQIRAHSPCSNGWTKLLAYLDKTKADDEPLNIATILDSNGLDDALWCLRAVENEDKKIRLFAVWCAHQVQHLMADPRSLTALDVAEAFAHGNANKEQLEDAAWAARDAAWAARAAAGDAAWAAAGDAAWAARATAWAAARDAAWDAQEKELRRICEEVKP